MHKIQKHSQRIRFVLQALFVLIPISIIYFWVTVQTPQNFFVELGIYQFTHDINSITQLPLSTHIRMLAILTSLVFSMIPLYALTTLIRLLKNYEQGQIFSLENTRCYRALGYCLFYWVVAGVIYGGLISVTLSFNNPPGERMLMLSFVGLDALNLLLATLIVFISWVMKEAETINDENIHTI